MYWLIFFVINRGWQFKNNRLYLLIVINKTDVIHLFYSGYNGEFDPGSGWTLAVCLTHASWTKAYALVADGWVIRENLPLGGEQQSETIANAPYAFEWKEKSARRWAHAWLASW